MEFYNYVRSVFGRGSGQTPLHWAAESGHMSVVRLLTDPIANMHSTANGLLAAVPDERGQTPADVSTM